MSTNSAALVDAVLEFCTANYENGWSDLVIETLSREEVAEIIGGAKTTKGAVAKVKEHFAAYAEQRASVRAEADVPGQVADTLAFIKAQAEEEETEDEADEGPITFIPAIPVDKDAQIQAVAARLAAEVFQEAEGGVAPEAPAVETPKPVKAKAAPRAKLTLTDLDGNEVESRRAPSPDTLALVLTLVEAFGGGKPFTNEAAAAIGFDEEALKRVFKRIKSWFGRDKVAHGKDGWVLSLRLQAGPDREEGVQEAAPAEAAA